MTRRRRIQLARFCLAMAGIGWILRRGVERGVVEAPRPVLAVCFGKPVVWPGA